MLTILIIIGAVLLLLVVIFVIVWKVRTHKFSPTSDKALLAANVNADLKETGFAYDMEEREAGLFCVGVSVPDYKGDYVYGISISAPLARMQEERLEEVKKHLWDTRERIIGVIGKKKNG